MRFVAYAEIFITLRLFAGVLTYVFLVPSQPLVISNI